MVKESFIELIEKYLSGSATDSEQHLVEEYVMKLEAKGSTLFDNEQEQRLKEAIWQQIQLKTIKRTAEVVEMKWYKRKAVRSIAVAASIILVIGLTIVLFTNNKPVRQPDTAVTGNDTISLVHHEVNTTGKEKRIELSDGSLILLANNSEVIYRQPFDEMSREIRLIGKAYFKVAKDTTRPFSVISGEISTTALGTEFTVTAFKESKQIVVRLYEGRVVIKPLDKLNKKMKKEVYLLPGQEFVYGSNNVVKNKVYKKNSLPEQVLNEEKFLDDPSIPENEKGSWYMFNNQQLASVIDQLSALYNVKIDYDRKDVQNVYFTGKYERTESLEIILKRIGVINNLKIIKTDTAFLIGK